ncbi:hypothetical protein AVDCRST_MAG92-1216 [uncultured Coleofasciculus sp.]|uniref:Uncharacterized protein n=1 Tax=uncultured Coleofasciculus sp. TaxID=1267456 RepID=A0A6J4HXD7_9CYAN|nr:hypothetical protein AVDCRST_MAG92-1216 [uncultured Coleofasciculus sp.]
MGSQLELRLGYRVRYSQNTGQLKFSDSSCYRTFRRPAN